MVLDKHNWGQWPCRPHFLTMWHMVGNSVAEPHALPFVATPFHVRTHIREGLTVEIASQLAKIKSAFYLRGNTCKQRKPLESYICALASEMRFSINSIQELFLILTSTVFSSFKACKLQTPSAGYIWKPADDTDNVRNRKTATFPIYAKHFEEHSGICQLVQKKVRSWVRWCVPCLSSSSKEQVSTAVTVWTWHLLPGGGTWDGNPSNLFSRILHSCRSLEARESSWP